MNHSLPEVAIIIPAYNEGDILLDKIQNCRHLDYPMERLHIHIVTDGSKDDSSRILKTINNIHHHHRDRRKGKLAAVERIAEKITSPIVVLTDANCLLNKHAIRKLVRHYDDPMVGAVSGEKRILTDGNTTSASGEGAYWKYESWLKHADSDMNTLIGAAGELFSFRRTLFENLPKDTIIEDFVLSMRIAMKGYKVKYEPEAIAHEFGSFNMHEEWKRKVRICAGGFQSIKYLPGILNPFRYGLLSFQYLSHRFLRWAVVPFVLPLLFVIMFLLAIDSNFYMTIFTLASGGMVLGVGGLLLPNQNKVPKVLLLPSYFILMNAAAYAGLARYISKSQSARWEKSKRLGGK